jgi:hypothetical protein
MCAVLVIRVDNTTPIIVNREKSVTLKYSALAYPTKRSHKIGRPGKEAVSGFRFSGGWNLEIRSGKRRLPEKKLRFGGGQVLHFGCWIRRRPKLWPRISPGGTREVYVHI